MPNPSDYATEDEWMGACVPAVIDEGKDQDQAVAQCMQMWRDRNKSATTVNRAYSVLTIKSLDAEQRTIEGVATTPGVDRIGDIVEPMGAKFTLPLPLLHQHRHDQPVGQVVAAKATKDGITIKARLAKIDEPGPLKDRVDTAWGEIKAGLVRGLSIGFSPVYEKIEQLKDGGLRFNEWGWHELSLVTIAANTEATISVVRSADQGVPAAMGDTDTPAPRPGASGKSPVNLKLTKERATMQLHLNDQIQGLESKRAANIAAMNEIMAKAAAESRSTDEEERSKFGELKGEVAMIDADLESYRDLDRLNVAAAAPVGQPKTLEDGAKARGNGSVGHIQVREPKLPPGIAFARMVQMIGRAKGDYWVAAKLAEESFPDHPSIANCIKAAVAAGTTTDSTWAGALVSAEGAPFADFLEFFRPKTILGKFGQNGIPDLSHVPFRVPLGSQTSGGAGYWVGEGQAKPLTRLDFDRTTLLPLKVANIIAVTKELVRFSGIAVETRLRDEMVKALAARLDVDLVDPTKTATQFSPASITNGVALITSAGSSVDAMKADIRAVMDPFLAANNPAETAVWIMAPSTALSLSMMTTSLGVDEKLTRELTLNGGTFAGLPVIVSNHIGESGSPTGRYVWLVNAGDIWLGEEGGFEISMSTEASLVMDDAPNMASGGIGSPETSGGSAMVSMFQTNSVAFLAERYINWKKARAQAVQGIQNVQWGL